MDQATQLHIVNARALAALPPAEFHRHQGEFALLVEGAVVSYHQTNREALETGYRKCGRAHFSVMRVDPHPARVGFTVCADYPR